MSVITVTAYAYALALATTIGNATTVLKVEEAYEDYKRGRETRMDPTTKKPTKAIREPASSAGDTECIICFEPFSDEIKRMVLIPCGHANICSTCGEQVQSCPSCNQMITDRKIVYL